MRRRKPQEGTFQKPKAKSRWCVLGHQDPDAADMFTYAPSPQTESIMMFFFLLQACDLTLSIADLQKAFCQSDSPDRSAGSLFVEPCEGLDLPRGSLIQLVTPVHGLNDAPLRWHRTLTGWLVKQGYRKSLLEPCLYTHYAPGGSVDGLILIEVDDLAIGSKRSQETEFQQRFQAAFRFGTWEKREASYAGRRTRQRSDCTLSKRLPHDHSIDAKSVFDALIKECVGSRQDRRTAVGLAIVRETLKAQGSRIRGIPHPLTPPDAMTKVDPSAGNDARTCFALESWFGMKRQFDNVLVSAGQRRSPVDNS